VLAYLGAPAHSTFTATVQDLPACWNSTATHERGVPVEDIAISQSPQLHAVIIAMGTHNSGT
jgi:hypothetical protein